MKTKWFGWKVPVVVVLIGGTLLWAGCKEKNVPFAVDKDELIAYISSSPDAADLFRSSNLFGKGPYHLPGTSATYRDSVVSNSRQVLTQIGTAEIDHGSYGDLREAVLIVEDDFLIHTTKINGVDTTSTQYHRLLRRYGYFWKVGTDAQPFLGWTLWGFNGFRGNSVSDPNLDIDLVGLGSFVSPADKRLYVDSLKDQSLVAPHFVNLRTLPLVERGSLLQVKLAFPEVGSVAIPRLQALMDSGSYNQLMFQVDSTHWQDTVQTLVNTTKGFDFLQIHFTNKNIGNPILSSVFIPYRVKP
ncbi:MAG: hypothetical protein WAU88_04760 [Candidatus Zixiibacteriota bacterium]